MCFLLSDTDLATAIAFSHSRAYQVEPYRLKVYQKNAPVVVVHDGRVNAGGSGVVKGYINLFGRPSESIVRLNVYWNC